ncbi:hypothetical protein [Sulfurisoma sediminicola]|uniref:hypothetical protein n=1 Tax=Sulfurisoma sediminicola TaxID=1381557 RepID=UPI000EAE83E5|nr:hypothetical protein [Sulfurisoma sediminicola]
MTDQSRAALDLLRLDEKLSWVSEQLVASFTEGITHSAKEETGLGQRNFLDSMDLTPRERTKREKYEMSRPYDESEKMELIQFALKEIFVTLPSMQDATAKALRDLGSRASAIEFSAPDDEERPDGGYQRSLRDGAVDAEDLSERFAAFRERLAK